MKKNIIAISREFGSGGRTIGRLVAQKLGIQFYDRDIIKKVVEESGLTRKYVEHYGEFAPSADQRFAYSFVGLDEDSNSPLVQLWKTREKVIKDFATAKPCVIVGSCADYILREREDCLNVFIFADNESKIERAEKYFNITREEAPAVPTTKKCPFCKSEIAIDATRCPHCTSQLDK